MSSFLSALGVLAVVLDLLQIFVPDELRFGGTGLAVVLIAAAAVALVSGRPRRVVSQVLPPSGIAITIKVGDVFAVSRGNVVVGSNDVFDTQFEDGVISPTSAQGQLLANAFGGDRAALDGQIANSLVGRSMTLDSTKSFGKRERYEIGTVAVLELAGRRFFLPAMARMSSTTPANIESSVEDLQVALARTWEAIRAAGQAEPVHMPILGSGMARLALSKTLIIEIIVLSFVVAAVKNAAARSLTIYIHEPDAEVVDLAAIEDWLATLCAS